MIWDTLLDTGRIAIAEKAAVLQFLQEHKQTYLAYFDVDRMVDFIQQCEEPSRHKELFQAPKLLGKGRSVSGLGPGRLQDDLSERIYVAYYALRRFGIRNARGRITFVLNALGLHTNPRSKAVGTWGSAEVNERVQQFEARMARQQRLPKKTAPEEIQRLRNMRVDSWIHGFHFASAIQSDGRILNSPTDALEPGI